MKAQTARWLRQVHRYTGVFFAPAIVFFAFSGAFQTFRWQEEKGFGGTPPAWIVWIASVHKDQAVPRAESPRPAKMMSARSSQAPEPSAEQDERKGHLQAPERRSTLPLKIFVLLLSIALTLSSITGVVIALNNRGTRRTSVAMLAAGTLLPLLLLLV